MFFGILLMLYTMNMLCLPTNRLTPFLDLKIIMDILSLPGCSGVELVKVHVRILVNSCLLTFD